MTRWTQEQLEDYMSGFTKDQKDQVEDIKSDISQQEPETPLQRNCEKWLNDRGYPFIHDRSRRKNKKGKILDLHIYLPKRHVVIELKGPGNKLTKEQKKTFQKIKFLGHEIYEVRSYKRFLEIMNNRE